MGLDNINAEQSCGRFGSTKRYFKESEQSVLKEAMLSNGYPTTTNVSQSTVHADLQNRCIKLAEQLEMYYDNNAGCTRYDDNNNVMTVPKFYTLTPVAMPSAKEAQEETKNTTETKAKAARPAARKSGKKDLTVFAHVPANEVTTLMVRGIPCSFSKDTLLNLLDNNGFTGRYDFFYLPRASNTGSNLGYAFINFVDHESAEQCTLKFHGVPLDPTRSLKVCSMSPADIQGLANLKKHFRRTAVSRGSRGPVFVKGPSPQKKDGM
jgi:hypothetical protein